MELNSRGRGGIREKKSVLFAMKQPDDNGKCSSLTVEDEYIQEEKAEASLLKRGTDKVQNSSKRCKMKSIFGKGTAVGSLTASE